MKEVQRTFIPGSEWIYIKVYTGSNTADKMLVNELSKFISALSRKKYIEKWFFIRYSDPDFHLRVRIKVRDCMFIGEVIRLFYHYLKKRITDESVWKVQLDTYNRELERYKEHLMELTETMFCIDSNYMLKILKILDGMPQPTRWLIAVKMIDALLMDFGYDLQQKKELLERMDKSYKMEFGFTEFNYKQFNVMYREHSHELEEVLWNKKKDENYQTLYEIIKFRSKELKKTALQLMKEDKNREMKTLIISYIHMMLVRLFCSKNRIYELIVYNFMHRLYASHMARMKCLVNAHD